MSRSFPRTLVVVLVTVALSLAVLAPAGAAPAPQRPRSTDTTSDWIAGVWAVLQGFLTGAPTRPSATSTTVELPPLDPGIIIVPATGGCIDPLGRPKPCIP